MHSIAKRQHPASAFAFERVQMVNSDKDSTLCFYPLITPVRVEILTSASALISSSRSVPTSIETSRRYVSVTVSRLPAFSGCFISAVFSLSQSHPTPGAFVMDVATAAALLINIHSQK